MGKRAAHINMHSLQPSMAGTNFFTTASKLGKSLQPSPADACKRWPILLALLADRFFCALRSVLGAACDADLAMSGMVDGASGSLLGLDVEAATALGEQLAKRFGAKEVIDGMIAGLEKDLFYIHVQADGDLPLPEARLRYFNAITSGGRPHQPFSDFANAAALTGPPLSSKL